MNIRKPTDYTKLYAQLDAVLSGPDTQMDQYAAIGKAVALRSEKGAAVAAADYLREAHPELSGFSPRNLRRMRAFYQTYGNHPDLLELAMRIGWTRNVLILEADLTLEERAWYLNAALRFGWTKTTLKESWRNPPICVKSPSMIPSLCGILKVVKLLAGKGGNRA